MLRACPGAAAPASCSLRRAPCAASARCRPLVASASLQPGAEASGLNLVLIGGRGCGKSSISRRIASLDTRWCLLSLDALIRYESSGQTVAQIVQAGGWAHFRNLEHTAILKATALPEWALIDAGGGAVVDLAPDGSEVLSDRKVSALRANAMVVYVKRDVRYLLSRLAKKAAASASGIDAGRPTLSASESFEAVMTRRSPMYEAVAHLVVDGCNKDGDPRPKETLAAEILKAYWAKAGEARAMSKGALFRTLDHPTGLHLTPSQARCAPLSTSRGRGWMQSPRCCFRLRHFRRSAVSWCRRACEVVFYHRSTITTVPLSFCSIQSVSAPSCIHSLQSILSLECLRWCPARPCCPVGPEACSCERSWRPQPR